MVIIIIILAAVCLIGAYVFLRIDKSSKQQSQEPLDEQERVYREFEKMRAEMGPEEIPVKIAPHSLFNMNYVVIFALILGAVWFFNNRKTMGDAPGNMSSDLRGRGTKSNAEQLLDKYEETVNFYKEKLAAAESPAEYQRIINEELTPEVVAFGEQFNKVLKEVDIRDFRRIQGRMNRINNKYSDMYRRRKGKRF